jgi:hypothetical protein
MLITQLLSATMDLAYTAMGSLDIWWEGKRLVVMPKDVVSMTDLCLKVDAGSGKCFPATCNLHAHKSRISGGPIQLDTRG